MSQRENELDSVNAAGSLKTPFLPTEIDERFEKLLPLLLIPNERKKSRTKRKKISSYQKDF